MAINKDQTIILAIGGCLLGLLLVVGLLLVAVYHFSESETVVPPMPVQHQDVVEQPVESQSSNDEVISVSQGWVDPDDVEPTTQEQPQVAAPAPQQSQPTTQDDTTRQTPVLATDPEPADQPPPATTEPAPNLDPEPGPTPPPPAKEPEIDFNIEASVVNWWLDESVIAEAIDDSINPGVDWCQKWYAKQQRLVFATGNLRRADQDGRLNASQRAVLNLYDAWFWSANDVVKALTGYKNLGAVGHPNLGSWLSEIGFDECSESWILDDSTWYQTIDRARLQKR